MKIVLTQTRSHNYNKVELTLEHEFEYNGDVNMYWGEFDMVSEILNSAIDEEYSKLVNKGAMDTPTKVVEVKPVVDNKPKPVSFNRFNNTKPISPQESLREFDSNGTYSNKSKFSVNGEPAYLHILRDGNWVVRSSARKSPEGYDLIIANIYGEPDGSLRLEMK